MIHEKCKNEPLVRGIKQCTMKGCLNMTYSNYTMCDSCSEDQKQCTKCGEHVEPEPEPRDLDAMADNEITQAKRLLGDLFNVPAGFADERVDTVVECIVKGALLKTTAIMRDVFEKGRE